MARFRFMSSFRMRCPESYRFPGRGGTRSGPLSLAFALALASPAQAVDGDILGVVKDDTGALMPGALITARNLDTRTVIDDMPLNGRNRTASCCWRPG
jgi:hypothetical protein